MDNKYGYGIDEKFSPDMIEYSLSTNVDYVVITNHSKEKYYYQNSMKHFPIKCKICYIKKDFYI